MPLYDVEKKQRYAVEKMPSLKLLNSLGMREGISVSVLTRQPLGGPVVIQIGRRSIAIAKDIAQQIEVRRLT